MQEDRIALRCAPGTRLSDAEIEQFIQCIKECKNLREFTMHNFIIAKHYWTRIFQAIQHHHTLEYVDVTKNGDNCLLSYNALQLGMGVRPLTEMPCMKSIRILNLSHTWFSETSTPYAIYLQASDVKRFLCQTTKLHTLIMNDCVFNGNAYNIVMDGIKCNRGIEAFSFNNFRLSWPRQTPAWTDNCNRLLTDAIAGNETIRSVSGIASRHVIHDIRMKRKHVVQPKVKLLDALRQLPSEMKCVIVEYLVYFPSYRRIGMIIATKK